MGWSALIYGLLIASLAWLLGDHRWAVVTRRSGQRAYGYRVNPIGARATNLIAGTNRPNRTR
jgi:hypothetical protein